MRLLHVIATLDPKAGGPPAVALRLAAAQALMGHEVTILAHAEPGAEARTSKSLEGIPGIKQVRFATLPPPASLSEKIRAGQARAWMDQNLGGVQMLHLHGVWEAILRVAGECARARSIPYALVPHGMLDPWCMTRSLSTRVKKQAALALGYRALLNHAAFLHTLNADEETGMKPLGLKAPCEVIPNGVFLEEIGTLPAPGSFHAQHPELEGEKFILFLSRVHFKKGLDYLIDAFAQVLAVHPRLRLVIAGPDDGALQPALTQAKERGIDTRVHAIGPVYGSAKYAAFVDAEVFCLPSRQEGFSVAITEALACACPVVISRECHFPEVATADAGRVVSLSSQATATGLLEVLGSDDARRAMGQRGRELIVSSYTWPAIAQRTQEAYRSRARVNP
jgi:glycosyltransferase involved in cell wall biosynthesis